MDQEILKLINLLPGLYYSKERIEEEIQNIESIISMRLVQLKKKYQRRNVESDIAVKSKPNSSISKQISQQQKTAWANYTPEQRQQRIDNANIGRQKAKKLRLRNERKAQKEQAA